MVQTTVNLDVDQNKKLKLYAVMNDLPSKEAALKKLVDELVV